MNFTPSTKPESQKATLSEKVYEELKDRILSLHIQPGETLQERTLAKELNVSRTPVREALLRLSREGWIDLNVRRSILVKTITRKDIDEIFEVRKLIEEFALREIFERKLNRKLAGELDLVVQKMKDAREDRQIFAQEDLHYHEAFIGILENSRLQSIWSRISEEVVRLGMISTETNAEQLDRILQKHEELVEWLWENDQEKALAMVHAIREGTYGALHKKQSRLHKGVWYFMTKPHQTEGKMSLLVLFALVFSVIATGVLGYRLIAGLSLIDSLFYTITTLTTVGYEAPPNMTPLLKIFSVFIMISGIGTMGYAIAHLSQRIIINRMLVAMGKRRNKAVDKLSEHWIICGFGAMGGRISQELRRKKTPFAIIEMEEERCRNAGEEGYLVIPGDARDESVLLSAGIASAKGIMIALNNDANNVYVILTARHLAPKIRILARANSSESLNILYRAGADKVFNPVNTGALAMASAAMKPEVSDFLELLSISSDMSLEFGSYRIEEGSPLVGKTLAKVPLLSKYNILVIGIRRKDGTILPTPSGNAPLQEEDMLIVLGEENRLHTAMEEIYRGQKRYKEMGVQKNPQTPGIWKNLRMRFQK